MQSTKGRVATRVVAEFLVITAGVLVALAADEWRQNRADAAVGARYLEELARDLQADTAAWAWADGYLAGKLDALDRAWVAVREPDLGAEAVRSFLADLTAGARAAYDAGTGGSRTTFDELVGSGRLHLIPPELRRRVLEYYEAVELQQARLTARETQYASLIYTLIPRDSEFEVQKDLGTADLSRIARRAHAADLEGAIIAERNRGRLRREIVADLYRRAAELLRRLDEAGVRPVPAATRGSNLSDPRATGARDDG